jgi:hypothetical protein
MEEPGVSKLVAVNLRGGRLGRASVATEVNSDAAQSATGA